MYLIFITSYYWHNKIFTIIWTIVIFIFRRSPLEDSMSNPGLPSGLMILMIQFNDSDLKIQYWLQSFYMVTSAIPTQNIGDREMLEIKLGALIIQNYCIRSCLFIYINFELCVSGSGYWSVRVSSYVDIISQNFVHS